MAKANESELSWVEQEALSFVPFQELTGADNQMDMCVTLRGFRTMAWIPALWPKIRNFPIQPNDILLASFPKCGTTWLQQVVYLVVTEDFEGAQTIPIQERVPFLEMPSAPTPEAVDDMAARPSPRLIKTHLPPIFLPKDATKAKMVFMYRNAKDTVVSYYYHYILCQMPGTEFTRSFEDFARAFMKGELCYCPFFELLKSYLEYKKAGNSILMIRYEDMKKDTRSEIRKIAQYLGKGDMSEEVLEKIIQATSFDAMRKNVATNYTIMMYPEDYKGPQFIRKGIVGDWKNHFGPHPELLNEFEAWIKANVPPELLCEDQ